jgi:MYXO-CTERM domain-containing protein
MLSVAFLASILASGPVLEAPWACGTTFSCTQGNGGGTSHTGMSQYAWDFGMPLGTEVKAAHGGTVLMIKMNSNSGGCDSQYANSGNYVLIDHGDGTAGLYLHLELNSSSLTVGSAVATGDAIGRVGLTGYTCGPHLHFQVQQICASWWCQSVPSEFFGHGVVTYGEQMLSENCGPCTAALAGGQTTISESEVQCFDRLTKWWWSSDAGLDGHHWFTYATAAGQAETIGRWRFSVETPGDYEVEVHVPTASADATSATYFIHHAGEVDQVSVDQSSQKGWQPLGVFYFDGGGDELLELPDNTGDAQAQTPLAFDSVRFTYLEDTEPGDGDGDPSGDGYPSGDGDSPGDGDGDPCPIGQAGCMCTVGGACDPGAVCVQGYCTPDTTGSDEDGDAGGTETGGGFDLDRGGDDGCACSAEPQRGAPLGALALLGLGLLGRRRRA